MIPVTVLSAELKTTTGGNFDLGRAPGSSLRGALYNALRTMYDTRREIASPADRDSNPVGWLLHMEDNSQSGGRDVPRPLSLRPPLDSRSNTIELGLAFYGQAREAIPMVLSALPLMGKIGVGRYRQHFTLDAVHSVDPLTHQTQPLLDSKGQRCGDLLTPPTSTTYQQFASLLSEDTLQIDFLTPTRIIDKGKLVQQPHLRPLIDRLLGRVRILSQIYTDTPQWVAFHELKAIAEQIMLSTDQTRWYEAWSGSRRDGRVKPLGGFIGRCTYHGPLDTLLPYLLLGQALQVGKNTIKGCGWYRIHYTWRS